MSSNVFGRSLPQHHFTAVPHVNHSTWSVYWWQSSWKIFRIGTVHYAEGLWRMRRHGPVIAHCTDSEDFPSSCRHRLSVSVEQTAGMCWLVASVSSQYCQSSTCSIQTGTPELVNGCTWMNEWMNEGKCNDFKCIR